jgi:hypothetical protein
MTVSFLCLLLVSLPSVAYSLDSPAGNVLVSDDAKGEGNHNEAARRPCWTFEVGETVPRAWTC